MPGRDGGAVIEQNRDGVITEWNTNASALFGWTRDEAVGMRSHLLIPARNRARHDEALADFIRRAPQRAVRWQFSR